MHALAGEKSLQRCNTVLVPQPPTHPRPPGAFVTDLSFVVPGFPRLDDQNLPPFVTQKLFFDALDEGRQALLRAEEERRKLKKEAEHTRKVEQDSKARAQAARRRAEDAERARSREEERRKAEAARRQAEMENFLHQERIRKVEEARRLAEEERQRRAEQEREVIERERREREAAAAQLAAAQLDPLTQLLCVYEDKWKALHGNTVGVGSLRFDVMPWPSLENVEEVENITDERVRAFLSHLERFKGCNGKRARRVTFIRSELRRWHPDKFEGQVLSKVIEDDRKEACEAAVHITRVLNNMLESAVKSTDNE